MKILEWHQPITLRTTDKHLGGLSEMDWFPLMVRKDFIVGGYTAEAPVDYDFPIFISNTATLDEAKKNAEEWIVSWLINVRNNSTITWKQNTSFPNTADNLRGFVSDYPLVNLRPQLFHGYELYRLPYVWSRKIFTCETIDEAKMKAQSFADSWYNTIRVYDTEVV